MSTETATSKLPGFLEKLPDEERLEFFDFLRREISSLIDEKSQSWIMGWTPARSAAIQGALGTIVKKTGDSFDEALLKALILYEVAVDASNEGQRLAILSKDYRFVREIVGVGRTKPEPAEPEPIAS